MAEPQPTGEDGIREAKGDRHYSACDHALCPCYLAGLRVGVDPVGPALLATLEAVQDGGPTDG